MAAAGQALALQPQDLAALVFLGDVQRAMGRVEPAREAYERAVSVSPRCAPVLYGLGEIAAAEGNSRRAVEMFEAALRVQPEANRIHYPLSLAYGRLGNAAKARSHLALRGDAEPALADPLYDAVLRLNPVTYARRGQDALQAGNLAQALQLLRPAAEALPEDPEIRMHLGAALARSGDFEAALEQYQEAVRLQPTNPRAHYNLGTTLTSMGRDDEAVVALRRAVELHPEFPQALFNLGQAMRRFGRHAEALPFLEQTIRVSPTHEPGRLARARVLAKLGRCREAVASVEEGLTILPESRALKGLLARLLAACAADRTADAARALQIAEQVFAEEGTAENAAGRAFVARRARRVEGGGTLAAPSPGAAPRGPSGGEGNAHGPAPVLRGAAARVRMVSRSPSPRLRGGDRGGALADPVATVELEAVEPLGPSGTGPGDLH